MSNSTNPVWDAPNDYEVEEKEENIIWGSKDGIIFLIDATEPMFVKQEFADSCFRTALKCCHATMLKKVRNSAKDLVGVILFGTKEKQNSLNAGHLTVLQKLEQPNIEKIKSLDAIIKSDSYNNFKDKYGHSDDYILQDALWLCQFIFSECEVKLGAKRIFLFTANDNPYEGNRIDQQKAFDRAQILNDLKISLELFPLGTTFDPAKFYKELVEIAMGEDYSEQMLPKIGQSLEELLKQTCRYSHKQRSINRVLFYLGPDLAIGVGIYSMMCERTLPARVLLESATNLPVQPVTHHFNADTGEKVLPLEIKKFKRIGGQSVIFNNMETKETKILLDPGFYLMGFKPQERVKFQHHFKKPYFLFPDEKQVKGSSKLFAALLKRCTERKKVAMCWGVRNTISPPRLFALFPKMEVINSSTGTQAAGFLAYSLPFSENIRSLPFEKMTSASPEQVHVMNEIVEKLTFKYDTTDFPNPRLQTLWAGIEALALGMDEPREITDSTKPNYSKITDAIAKLDVNLDEIFYPDGKDVKQVKRAGAVKKEPALKKPKMESDDFAEVEEHARQKKVEKLKVDQLKAYLMSKDQKVTGKRKAELVNMVYELVNMDV